MARIDEEDCQRASPVVIPENVSRSTRGGRTYFIPYQTSEAIAAVERCRATQIKTRQRRRDIRQSDEPTQVRIDKLMSVIRLTSSFMAELAAQDNARLEVVQESWRTRHTAEMRLERHKRDTAEAIKTYL
jgi:hypothetical protein